MNYSNSPLSWSHPIVKEWFLTHIGTPSLPQIKGWQSILSDKPTLISAPTGSGKTLAAFLVFIDYLVKQALNSQLEDLTQIVYISPLKALSNDIQKNLARPLKEMTKIANEKGLDLDDIRVSVRTGDTPSADRQKMLKKPPHILVTTPESLYILLTADKSRAMLSNVKTIIVDEIHALTDNKRGAHLALSLERLSALCLTEPIRIGLSATQKPIEVTAQYLVGHQRPLPNIIDIGHKRPLEIQVIVPSQELGSVASNEMWDEIYDRIAEFTAQHRSTLIFANTRRLTERIAHHLRERLGEDQVAAHHGSLSRKIRLSAETRLKNGELKVLVATASLELGIDIGTVDLVCQIGSPRSIAIALQRIGRSGHVYGAISKGYLFATTRDELVECAALVHAILQGELDQLILPQEPLDILAQQIIAICAAEDWDENKLFGLIKSAYPYRNLAIETFNEILIMLADGISGSRGRYGAYLHRDQINKRIRARRGARITAITSGGAIPDNGLFTVIAEPGGVMVGTLDEDFAVESNRGDIILLGTTSWQIKRVEARSGRVIVSDAHGAPPTVPFWRGEAPSRTQELSLKVSELRQKINDDLEHIQFRDTEISGNLKLQSIVNHLKENYGLNQSGAEQLIEYIAHGRAILGTVPSQNTIIAERFFDESGGMQLIIHAPFGARINKAFGLALRKKFCRSFNFELQASATDEGLNIALAEQHSFPLSDVFQFLHPNTLKETLTQAVLQSPIFTTRFRWCATRSLSIPRFRFGKKVAPNILRMLTDDLLAAVFPDAAACQDNLAGKEIEIPNHPLVNEAIKDTLNEALDLSGLTQLITAIVSGKLKCIAIDSTMPSVFAHEILNANPYAYLDDAPLEERRARAVSMRRLLPQQLLANGIGKLDLAAIKEIEEEAWPDIRNADELHDALQTFIALPTDVINIRPNTPIDNWMILMDELIRTKRASSATVLTKTFYLCTENKQKFLTLYPECILQHEVPDIIDKLFIRDEILLMTLRGWACHLGPFTSSALANFLSLDKNEIECALIKLETTGFILRGQFVEENDEIEWCERRLLARIHRLTLGRLRNEIKSVTSSQFIQWLLKWQHLVPETQLHGENGLIEIISQLQGFEAPANAWETKIFARRIKNYQPDLLDHLCMNGVIGWKRISVHPLIEKNSNKKVVASSIAPITFFIRDQTEWMPNTHHETINLTQTAEKIYHFLQQQGASFLNEITAGVGGLPSMIENGLWELVSAGKVTADSFDNLRALINPKRRLRKKRFNHYLKINRGSRWSIVSENKINDSDKQIEAISRLLLKRYGVVFRDLLAREKNIPTWRELLICFRRLEERGEIRGGRFVDGFHGEQFALPYALESLRAIRKETALPSLTIYAADPLNLIGIILPGSKISTLSRVSISLPLSSSLSHPSVNE